MVGDEIGFLLDFAISQSNQQLQFSKNDIEFALLLSNILSEIFILNIIINIKGKLY